VGQEEAHKSSCVVQQAKLETHVDGAAPLGHLPVVMNAGHADRVELLAI